MLFQLFTHGKDLRRKGQCSLICLYVRVWHRDNLIVYSDYLSGQYLILELKGLNPLPISKIGLNAINPGIM